MFYCHKDCQLKDWQSGHKYECKVFRGNRYCTKSSSDTQRLLHRLWLCIKSDESFTTQTIQLFDGSVVCLNDMEVDVSLISEAKECMEEFEMICDSFEYFGHELYRKEMLRWFALIKRNTRCLNTEPQIFGDFQPKCSLDSALYLCLYPQLSSVGHSCCPNSALVDNGFKLQLRAVKPISTTDEITISFIDLINDKTDRKELLKKYFIVCKCEKCEHILD
ncbi:unnamed protein product [Oppiella nova]|uniref:Uncharacterized protein n=1 Tax=Oppiella nova TaxID=334625 RepID=A0A7R9QKQ8_9ACAR|nr:unnamed protein product [Oppiella nova]CAG2167916.1 unnamed protein product [Oppiella nova]